MKRKDMDPNVWYVAEVGCATHAVRVVAPGKPPAKVLVVYHRGVYPSSDPETIARNARVLADVTAPDLAYVAAVYVAKDRNEYRASGPLHRLEAAYVTTSAILAPWDEYIEDRRVRAEADRAERLERETKVRQDRLAVAARWGAVADLVDLVHPEPRHTVHGSRRESETLVAMWSYDEHGRTSHVDLHGQHVTYGQLLDVYEAWANDRADSEAALSAALATIDAALATI